MHTTDLTAAWLGADFRAIPGKTLLFCLPFAGGGSRFYSNWQNLLAPSVQVCPVFLPGRERRIREPLRHDMTQLLEELMAVITPLTRQPYAFFGHSMGALISYLLSSHLVDRGFPAPAHLFVSARGCVSAQQVQAQLQQTGFEQYLNTILGLSQQNAQLLSNEALSRIFLPIFRADVQLCTSWQPEPVSSLPSAISVLYGDTDHSISLDALLAWQYKTQGQFDITSFNGGHLFVLDQAAAVTSHINKQLALSFVSSGQVVTL